MSWRINSNSNFWMTPWATQCVSHTITQNLLFISPLSSLSGSTKFLCSSKHFCQRRWQFCQHHLESSTCFIQNMFLNITKTDRLGFKREKKTKVDSNQDGWWVGFLGSCAAGPLWIWYLPPFLECGLASLRFYGTGSPIWIWCWSSSLDLLWIWYSFSSLNLLLSAAKKTGWF